MRLFLTILEGRSPSEAEPILATEDVGIIRLVGSWIARRLRAQEDHTPPAQDGRPGGSDGS